MTQSVENPRQSARYFSTLAPYFKETDMEEIRTAYAFSKYGHRNQTRDDGGRYFDHPKAVSLVVFKDFGIKFDWRVIVIALLHDIVEDQFLLTERRIEINFKRTVAEGVKFMTKDAESKTVYFERLFACHQWRPMVGKLADRIHNLRTLETCPPEKKRKQIKETRENFFMLCNVTEKHIPLQYKKAVTYARQELQRLCDMHEKSLEKS